MLDPWAEFIKDTINMIASISTYTALNAAQYQKHRAIETDRMDTVQRRVNDKKPKKPKPLSTFKTYFKYYWVPFAIALGGFSLISILYLFGGNTPPPTATPTPAEPHSIALVVPIKNNNKDAWLDELDPILPREEAFCWYQWSTFDPIQVKKTSFQHCIGVSIPLNELNAYNNNPQREIIHSEYIEYLLSYNYDTFQFDYGIDDLSFPDGIENACMCEYKIIVQSCNAKEYLGEDDNILFDSDWLNYRSILFRSTLMDVSKSESIRITIYWKFYIRQNGPSAFNIAIVNPILRVEKADTLASPAPAEYLKPDSNN